MTAVFLVPLFAFAALVGLTWLFVRRPVVNAESPQQFQRRAGRSAFAGWLLAWAIFGGIYSAFWGEFWILEWIIIMIYGLFGAISFAICTRVGAGPHRIFWRRGALYGAFSGGLALALIDRVLRSLLPAGGSRFNVVLLWLVPAGALLGAVLSSFIRPRIDDGPQDLTKRCSEPPAAPRSSL